MGQIHGKSPEKLWNYIILKRYEPCPLKKRYPVNISGHSQSLHTCNFFDKQREVKVILCLILFAMKTTCGECVFPL